MILTASALTLTIASSDADISADMRCLAVATRLGGAGEGDMRESGSYMTEFFLGRVHGRASSGVLARSFRDASAAITQDNIEQETKFCMMKFLQANEDLKEIGRQADAIR